MTKLNRGPDKYARPDLRHRVKELRKRRPDRNSDRALLAGWIDDAKYLLTEMTEALDRLDDAEALLEGRDP